MKTVTISLLLLVSVIFAGCAGGPGFTGPVSAPNDQAVVYVYYVHSGMIPRPAQDVFVNGDEIIKLPPGGYYIYHSNPGQLVFSNQAEPFTGPDLAKAEKHKTILELTVQRGQVYYVEQVFVMGIPRGEGSFLLRNPATALSTISDSVQVGIELPKHARHAAAVAAVEPSAPTAAAAPAAPAMSPAPAAPMAPAEMAPAPVAPPPVEKPHYDSVMTENCAVIADTAEEKAEVDSLIAFLKEQKENRDFNQIARIEFSSPDAAKIVFTWYGGQHLGTLTVVKDSGTWKITTESHSI